MDNRVKVVAQYTVRKKSAGGDFEGTSTNMESECSRRGLKGNDLTDALCIVHDNNNNPLSSRGEGAYVRNKILKGRVERRNRGGRTFFAYYILTCQR
ncbi:hypothetical protein TVAGG3_0126640 [Trichomonas vaginalis G3]|uniref:hypothetical protein n=1 Tax=Trichomonas vaginalis (strain ATCC PRA-98 / G3) TaxID=412133 RepID=UPI0021E5989F|nr:hypothetical protein TVAGG3_0126640 [Trichomonas vaginalis G3]KAI5545806.1 hypothetical protein TVAGG3_0126640 [Trichomonas vaginalis G3]